MAAAGRLAARTTVDRDEADPLTSREREAAALLDQALSNRQIAGRLVLSERTVESRMRGILTKTQCAKPDRVRGSVEPVMSMATARGLFGLDPADQVLPADRFQQGRMVGGHMPADHPDHLVIAIAAGHEPAFASDQFHPHASCSGCLPERNARMLA